MTSFHRAAHSADTGATGRRMSSPTVTPGSQPPPAETSSPSHAPAGPNTAATACNPGADTQDTSHGKASRPTRRRPQPRRLLALLLAGTATLLALDAGWVHAKANLAQHLLDRAWQRTLAEGGSHRPWPKADTRPVARLHRPDNAGVQTVLAGDNARTLAFGPGWAEASAAAGQPGTTVISGHRDTHFAWLEHANAGDLLALENSRGQLTRYQITGTTVIDSRHQRIPLHNDGDTLLLVTCWPFNAVAAGGPLRYVVSASVVPD